MAEEGYLSSDLLEAGHLISGRYQILYRLGDGGMGTVYLTRDANGEEVALKILHREYALNKVYVQRFIREIDLMNTISHPNVVRTYDAGIDEGAIYFTMEYVAGQSLELLIEKGTFPQGRIADFIIQVFSGLGEIHRHEVIHRDLKPANLLITADGSVKITDFGVARPKMSDLTSKQQKVGSILYMAPEIWLGKQLTAAVDFYAFGVVLYELVTGRLPFDGDSPTVLMEQHIHTLPVPPIEIEPELPAWLSMLILRLLEKNPKDRFKDTREAIEFVQSRSRIMKIIEHGPLVDGETPQPKMFTSSSTHKRIEQTRKTFVFKFSATQVMTEAKAQRAITRRKKTLVITLPRRAALILELEKPSRDFIYLGLFFASLQVADGILTSIGIERFGVVKEGNPLLRILMSHFSPDQTLLLVKAAAIFVVVLLTLIAKHMKWVKDLIGVLSCIYLFAAILPWIYVLYIKHTAAL